ncbi:MAG TPA: RHS repeat-associated core domain-containing protein, partial [Sedimentisphaerales bacterium]|nr:RHS repeat-associated core domain-containing protein [Sedimentisphaerales bacterium]
YEYNWDNKLRSATKGTDTISLKYDPLGNRIYKDSSVNGKRKYIVDIVSDLPVILMEIDPDNPVNPVKKTYIYANSQIVAQHDGDHTANRYFYQHDRLGNVRQIIKPGVTQGNLANHYTYDPFGELFAAEFAETVSNSFRFTGQYFDSEIDQYYLRARQYSPHIGRFTGRDLVDGKFEQPLTLHKYLYCENDPVNWIDLNGLWSDGIRYALRKTGVSDAYTLSDKEILSNKRWKDIWNNPSIWHGHSDFGYRLGDFDYTTLDNQWWTRPTHRIPVINRRVPGRYRSHFLTLKQAELVVGCALRSGNVEFFEQAMHMGQDYFSHLGKGYGPVEHADAEDEPDNPYQNEALKQLSREYKAAQKWTKQWENIFYLMWDTDTWWGLK